VLSSRSMAGADRTNDATRDCSGFLISINANRLLINRQKGGQAGRDKNPKPTKGRRSRASAFPARWRPVAHQKLNNTNLTCSSAGPEFPRPSVGGQNDSTGSMGRYDRCIGRSGCNVAAKTRAACRARHLQGVVSVGHDPALVAPGVLFRAQAGTNTIQAKKRSIE
jgi:hypothetical protein